MFQMIQTFQFSATTKTVDWRKRFFKLIAIFSIVPKTTNFTCDDSAILNAVVGLFLSKAVGLNTHYMYVCVCGDWFLRIKELHFNCHKNKNIINWKQKQKIISFQTYQNTSF
jgi:hypothetical protein